MKSGGNRLFKDNREGGLWLNSANGDTEGGKGIERQRETRVIRWMVDSHSCKTLKHGGANCG